MMPENAKNNFNQKKRKEKKEKKKFTQPIVRCWPKRDPQWVDLVGGGWVVASQSMFTPQFINNINIPPLNWPIRQERFARDSM